MSGFRNSRSRNAAGFTLVEIMLVMLILVALTGVVTINLHAGYQDLALDSDAAVLRELIQTAQVQARAKRCIERLCIDRALGEYYLMEAANVSLTFHPADNLGETHALDRSLHFYEVRKLAVGAKDHEQLNFYPDGSADAAVIILASDSGEERTIEIQGLAGPPSLGLQ